MQTTIVIMLGLVLIFQLVQMTIAGSSGGDGFNMQDRIDLIHIFRRVIEMSQAMERLQASVSSETTVIASVQTLLTDLSQRVRDANENDDTDELNNIADEIDQHAASLAAAVQANTPADPSSSGAVPESQPTTDTVLGQQQDSQSPASDTGTTDSVTDAPSGGGADVSQPVPESE
jgi:hypothetical protein